MLGIVTLDEQDSELQRVCGHKRGVSAWRRGGTGHMPFLCTSCERGVSFCVSNICPGECCQGNCLWGVPEFWAPRFCPFRMRGSDAVYSW